MLNFHGVYPMVFVCFCCFTAQHNSEETPGCLGCLRVVIYPLLYGLLYHRNPVIKKCRGLNLVVFVILLGIVPRCTKWEFTPWVYREFAFARCSMYGIFAYISPKFMVNVGKYSIHGACGLVKWVVNLFLVWFKGRNSSTQGCSQELYGCNLQTYT